ncbi:MAG: beta-ketoacyl-[acyl-carrier-protein] synthase family protein [Elusimicrobiota bacterium]|jgi:3-oxoacyl-[acyl-carrier-protein] synthase-1/3-oxoacyl-[acyl-carrier-protein] synthase II|nr:beta-ketoacyl-[acyl-carrier-protein] synthase family protein [Elusimicrobiota bacterium]
MKNIISGFGLLCALGENIAAISENLYRQEVWPQYPKDRLESSFAGEYPVFCIDKNIWENKKAQESFSWIFLKKALDEALICAQIDRDSLKNMRVGVCIGTSVDASFNCFDFYRQWIKGEPNISLRPLEKYLKYSLAKEVLKYLNVSGISQTIVTACASSTDAIGIGSLWIQEDLCDIVFCGGADELSIIPYTGFIKLMVASKNACRPFDKNRSGINLGEGAAALVLESEANFKKRKAHKYGFVLGYGTACDAYHLTSPAPDGRGLRRALDFAIKSAKISKDDIAFINAHGTASIDNDLVEGKVYNEILNNIPVEATKSLTGHCLGAAGAVEACLTLISLNNSKICKTKNFQEVDEKINLRPVCKDMHIDNSKAALSASLSFGGLNSVLVLGGQAYE